MAWVICAAPIVADVIRWSEPIWSPPRKKRGKPDKIGEQILTAEVLAVGEYFQLHVRAVEKVSLEEGAGKSTLTVKIGDTIKRKRATIERGNTERLLWSEESVRSKILSPDSHAEGV